MIPMHISLRICPVISFISVPQGDIREPKDTYIYAFGFAQCAS